MRKIALLTFIILLVFSTSADSWWNASWDCRKTIDIDRTKVPGNLTSFILVIDLTTDAELSAKALANGDDIAFVDTDDTTQLSHDLVIYTTGTGRLLAWIEVPNVDGSGEASDTRIYMYYSNAGAASQEDKAGTYDTAGFFDVYHNEEDPSGGSPQMFDSASEASNGIALNMESGDLIAGKLGSCLNFNDGWIGTDERVETVNPGDTVNTRTFLAWITIGSDAAGPKSFYDYGSSSNQVGGYYRTGPNTTHFGTEDAGAAVETDSVTTDDGTGGAWIFHVGKFDADGFASSDDQGIYWNGSFEADSSQTHPLNVAVDGFGYGGKHDTTAFVNCVNWQGKIDEFMVCSNALSDNYITTLYNNQNDPGTFITLGSESCNVLTPTQTITATPTLTVTATPTITETATQTVTATDTITATATNTVTATATMTVTPTLSITETATLSPTPTETTPLVFQIDFVGIQNDYDILLDGTQNDVDILFDGMQNDYDLELIGLSP